MTHLLPDGGKGGSSTTSSSSSSSSSTSSSSSSPFSTFGNDGKLVLDGGGCRYLSTNLQGGDLNPEDGGHGIEVQILPFNFDVSCTSSCHFRLAIPTTAEANAAIDPNASFGPSSRSGRWDAI